jgi:hypothetical protein
VKLETMLTPTENMKNIITISAVVLGLTALYAPAQEISIQFVGQGNALQPSQTPGVVPSANWNPITSLPGPVTLNDDTGAPTTAVYSESGVAGDYRGFGGNFPIGSDDSTLFSGQAYNTYLGSGAIAVNDVPYANYDVYAMTMAPYGTVVTYALATGGTNYLSLQMSNTLGSYVQSTNTFDGTGTAPSDLPGASYVEFTGVTNPNFSLSFGGEDPGTSNADFATINGIQIVAATVPEPATWAILACGVGILLAGQRFHRGSRIQPS